MPSTCRQTMYNTVTLVRSVMDRNFLFIEKVQAFSMAISIIDQISCETYRK